MSSEKLFQEKLNENHSKIFPTIWWNYCWNFNSKKVIIIIWFFVFLLLWKRERRKKLHNFSIIYFPQQLTSFFLISRKQKKWKNFGCYRCRKKKENVFHCDLRQKKVTSTEKNYLHEIDGEIKMFYKNLNILLISNRKAFFVQFNRIEHIFDMKSWLRHDDKAILRLIEDLMNHEHEKELQKKMF